MLRIPVEARSPLPAKCSEQHSLPVVVVPEGAALLEAEEVGEGGGVGCDAEAPALPLSGWNPGEGDVEAVQVVSG